MLQKKKKTIWKWSVMENCAWSLYTNGDFLNKEKTLASSTFQVDTHSWRISIVKNTCPQNAMALEKASESMATGYFHKQTSQKHLWEATSASLPSGVGKEGHQAPSFLSGSCSLMDTLQTWATSTSTGRGGAAERGSTKLSHQAQLGGRGSEGRDGWRLRACLRVSDGCGKRRQRGPNEKMEGGKEREGLRRGEAPPFFSLLFLGIWKLRLTGLSGSSAPLWRATAAASEVCWGCSWLWLRAASAAAVSSGPAPPPLPPPSCREDSSSGSAGFIPSSPPKPRLPQLASVEEASVSAAVAIAREWRAPGSFRPQGRRAWGGSWPAAEFSSTHPAPPPPGAALGPLRRLSNVKEAPSAPTRPESRSRLPQLFNRPQPPNVLASGSGGGGASGGPLYQ